MSNQILRFKTIEYPTTSLFKDRGSKFLGFAFSVIDLNDIKQKLKEVKEIHPKATHHCYAYRLGIDSNQFRANDDGEPSGSAGRPILGQIDSAGITNTLVIVVRYYGGTMLGVPGLINAYKVTTQLAFENATYIEKWVTKSIHFTFDYNVMSEVLYHLRIAEAEIIEQELMLFCRIKCNVPIVNYEKLLHEIKTLRSIQLL
jgi:uncharacterized YigZ family protein